MQYRKLGNSALSISRIGFGCMSLEANSEESTRLLREAYHLGVNYFDTADLYDKGANEILLGEAVKEFRHDIVLATKVGNEWRADGSGWDWNPGKDHIIRSVEKSLKRLQTDYIDLYQLHGGTLDDPIDETIEAFEELVAAGKIRYYGISSIRPNVIRKWVERANMVSVMMQYSALDRRPEETVFPMLHQNGIGVLARGSVAQGLLAGKPPKAYLGFSEEEVRSIVQKIKQAPDDVRQESQTALQFVLGNKAVTSAVAGIRTSEHLHEAVAAVEAMAMPEGELNRLRAAIPARQYTDHR